MSKLLYPGFPRRRPERSPEFVERLSRRIDTDFYCEIRDTNDEIRIIATDEALSAINEAPVVAYYRLSCRLRPRTDYALTARLWCGDVEKKMLSLFIPLDN